MDYFLGLYNPVLANSIRKAGEGISWIFQMGMGYTFYLPFAFYVAGLLCWSYTVIRLVSMGRVAGYGLALMFIAGYALLFSNLTLMVILGVMLLTLDRPKGRGRGTGGGAQAAARGDAGVSRGRANLTSSSSRVG
jgi:hypothetical protein